MKKSKQLNTKKIYLLITVFVIIIFSLVLIKLSIKGSSYQSERDLQPQNNISISPLNKMYYSKYLKITLDYPMEYQLEERLGTVYLKKDNNLIIVDRIGTNYNSIDDYLDYLTKINEVQIVDRQIVKVNRLNGMRATVKHPNTQNPDNKVYYFYINNFIYDISTTNPILYSDLDQIARSFRYTP